MRFEDTLDPELRPYIAARPVGPEVSVQQQRASFNALAESWRATAPKRVGVAIEDRHVPGPPGGRDVLVRIYRPLTAPAPIPVLLWVHGGAFRIGRYDMDEARCERIADELKCLVVSVEYRLAPENPFPAAPDDIYAALTWLAASAANLGVDPARVAIGGQSAGGGLAAGVALMARDRGGPALKFQLLLEPCVDDTHTTVSSRTITDPRVWCRDASLAAWKDYLGAAYGGEISPYAAPARAKDLSGSPSAFVFVADRDLIRDEAVSYAQRLMQAGVRTELHVYPGAFHGFISLVPDAGISRRATDEVIGALGRGMHG